MQSFSLGPREIPAPLVPFFNHLDATFPSCEVRFISNDYGRHNSAGILNPANDRSINIELDQNDIANGRRLLCQQEIDEIAIHLLI